MNWYKRAITETTMPYFQELAEEGEYVPNTDILKSEVKQRTGSEVQNELGCESNGCAYRLSNGDVLKITTSDFEGRLASLIMQNPNPTVAAIKNLWKHGDLYCIITEFVSNVNDPQIQKVFDWIKNMKNSINCYNIECAQKMIIELDDFPFKKDILDHLDYVTNLKSRPPFDFLNASNTGIVNGHLKFFDVN
jgi:hypothetical protein